MHILSSSSSGAHPEANGRKILCRWWGRSLLIIFLTSRSVWHTADTFRLILFISYRFPWPTSAWSHKSTMQRGKVTLNKNMNVVLELTSLWTYCICDIHPVYPELWKPPINDPSVFILTRFKVDVEQFPTINRLNQTLIEIEAFKVSHPSCQPDTPSDLRT